MPVLIIKTIIIKLNKTSNKFTFERTIFEIKYLIKMMKSAMFSTMNSGTNRSPVGVYTKKY